MKGTKRAKIRKNDQVVVITGRDKGKRGRVLAVAPVKGKIKVESIGMIKRHQKAAGNRGGGIIDRGSWLDLSTCNCRSASVKPSRVRFTLKRHQDESGSRERAPIESK